MCIRDRANTGPFSSWYEMWVSYIDPQAEAITFKYDRLGYSFELRVDLTGGEAG